MRRAFIAGIIAGLVAGIVKIIFQISGVYELLGQKPFFFPFGVQIVVSFNIIEGIIWGIIFGAFYAIFYSYIPSKGVRKGLVYGLIIWTFGNLRPFVVMLSYGTVDTTWLMLFSFGGFVSYCLVYGTMIGILYKK